MFHRWYTIRVFSIFIALLLLTVPAYAVKDMKVSNFGGGSQVWFEAEDWDVRDPDTDEFFLLVDEGGAFGKALTRAGGAGGRLTYTFDIGAAGGSAGTWYLWGRVINPSNNSDYMLIEGDPDDGEIPGGPPYPGDADTPPFTNDDDRIFEANIGDVGAWDWGNPDHGEGHTKELQDGVNTMHIYHRQGNDTKVVDVLMWTDNADYVPTDDDYTNAQLATAVEPAGKLATAWGRIKSAR